MNLVDYWLLINNTTGTSEYVAEGGKEMDTMIFDRNTFNQIKRYVRE